MARSTAPAFATFDHNIRLGAHHYGRIHARVDEMRRTLTKAFLPWDELPLVTAELMGSCARSTAIQPLIDIDILAVFGAVGQRAVTGEAADSGVFVAKVRERIAGHTRLVGLGGRGRAVHVDYRTPPGVCLTAALAAHGGGYAIPTDRGRWVRLDPRRHTLWSAAHQARLAERYRQRVRLVKFWNRLHGGGLGSWQQEVMVGSMFSTMSADPRLDLMHFFARAPEWIDVPDPCGGSRLSAGMSEAEIATTQALLGEARAQTVQAIRDEARGDCHQALALWRQIFGEAFPEPA